MKNILLLIIGFVMMQCSTDKNIPESNTLLGKWNWIESTGGIAGVTLTPKSTGKTIYLEISQNSIKKFVNGSLESEQKYTIQIQSSIFGGNKPMFVFENDSKSSFEIESDVLFINEECYDCFNNKYKKE